MARSEIKSRPISNLRANLWYINWKKERMSFELDEYVGKVLATPPAINMIKIDVWDIARGYFFNNNNLMRGFQFLIIFSPAHLEL